MLKTQLSNGIRSSLENNRYRYLRGGAGGGRDVCGEEGGSWGEEGGENERGGVRKVKKRREVNDITATKNSNTFCRFVKEQRVSFKGPSVKTLKTKDAV